MKILVTGGAGFIGSNFVRTILLAHPEYSVVNLDKLTYAGNLDNLRDVEGNKNYTFVEGDICDSALVEKVVRDGVDYIVNFAAETHVDRSISDATSFTSTNFYGAYVLLEAARKYDVKKYLQISTDEVYGSIESGSFTELDRLEPNNPYSASKAAADMMTRAYNRTYGMFTLITRSSNNFGPYQFPEKLIPSFILHALKGEKVPLYGDGLNIRDWLYVKDNCTAIDMVLQKGVSGEIYNIGSSNERTNLEITKIILEKLGKSEDLISFVKDRLGHDRRYSLDNSKVVNLGWKPQHEFTVAISETIEWYRENKWWWGALL